MLLGFYYHRLGVFDDFLERFNHWEGKKRRYPMQSGALLNKLLTY